MFRRRMGAASNRSSLACWRRPAIINVYLYQSGLIDTIIPPDQAAAQAEAIAAGRGTDRRTGPMHRLIHGCWARWNAFSQSRCTCRWSILVLQAIVRKNILWVVVAILWHALINAVAVFGAFPGMGPTSH